MEPTRHALSRSGPAVRAALRAAGWYAGREFDTRDWEAMLSGVGYAVPEWAVRIWRELGALTISSSADRRPSSSLRIDPVVACIDSVDESRLLSAHYGSLFVPLGMWSIQFRSYIAESGLVVAVGPKVVWKLGETLAEALAYVVDGDGSASRATKAEWLSP